MFRFANIEYLYALALLPVFWLVYVLVRSWRRRTIRRFGDPQLVEQLMEEISRSRPGVKLFFFSLSWLFLVAGLARPQLGAKLETVKKKGVEVIVALDVSNSMLAEDIQPSRLERAKKAIAKMVDRMENDRMGLIVFAGDAYVQIPLTSDYQAVKMFLPTIGPSTVPKQGTAIATAIEMAARSFSPRAEKSKALIIITDGENHDADPVEAARKAHEQGVTIHTIGIGKPSGAPIPITVNGQRTFLRDRNGHTVITRLDEPLLQQIAMAGGGIYVRATNASMGLTRIYNKIKGMDQKEMKEKNYSEYNDLFQYVIGLALFFLIIEWMISERRSRFLSGIKLFQTEEEER
jgi:Ca-activated chloride channel family protein